MYALTVPVLTLVGPGSLDTLLVELLSEKNGIHYAKHISLKSIHMSKIKEGQKHQKY